MLSGIQYMLKRKEGWLGRLNLDYGVSRYLSRGLSLEASIEVPEL